MPTTPLLTGSRHGAFALAKSNGWLFDPEREIAEGVRLARRAVAVGKDDPTALWSGGINLAYLAAVLETAAAYIDRAIVLNPNLAAAWSASGWLRIYLGEPASAIERLERSRRLSPLDPIAYMGYAGMALALLLADRYDEAASWAAKAINEQPNWAMPLRVAAIAYALSDRIVEAREAMARCASSIPHCGCPILKEWLLRSGGRKTAPATPTACAERGFPNESSSPSTENRLQHHKAC